MKEVRETDVLFPAIELLGELEQGDCDLIVEVQEFAVLSNHVENTAADFDEELDLRQNAVLLLQLVQIAVGEQNELLGSCLALLDDKLVGVGVQVAVRQKLRELVDALSLLALGHDPVVLFDQVLEHAFEEGHARVLADVSEESNVLTDS